MAASKRVEHEGVVREVTARTLEVLINSQSACSACHAKGACGMSDMKQKIISVPRPAGDFKAGDRVMVYAGLGNAFYSVLLAYILPSVLIIGAIFLIELSGCSELAAAVSSLGLLAVYFVALYLCRGRISKKITFTAERMDNY